MVLAFLCPFLAGQAFAAGSWTYFTYSGQWSYFTYSGHTICEFTADASDGSVPNLTLEPPYGQTFTILSAVVSPDDTSPPTDDFDVTITDRHGRSPFGSQLTDLANNEATTLLPQISNAVVGTKDWYWQTDGPLTITVSGNSFNSAKCKIIFYH